MSKPTEHKTVQARTLAYAQEIGWTIVTREEAEERRAGFPTRRGEAQGGQECPPSVVRATPRPWVLCPDRFHLRRGYCGQAGISAPKSIANEASASLPWCYAKFMTKTTIQAELPPELTARALAFVQEGWATDLNELLADALRRFLESHSARLTESMVMSDVQWGLHGND
jgi:hypothetical protein